MKMFVYGTLKRGYGNNRLMRTCEFLGEAISEDACYGMDHRGAPLLFEGGDKRVKGELWEVSDMALPAIDSLEGHPHFYCRREREFRDEQGRIVIAWVYLVDRDRVRSERALRGEYPGEYLEWPLRGDRYFLDEMEVWEDE